MCLLDIQIHKMTCKDTGCLNNLYSFWQKYTFCTETHKLHTSYCWLSRMCRQDSSDSNCCCRWSWQNSSYRLSNLCTNSSFRNIADRHSRCCSKMLSRWTYNSHFPERSWADKLCNSSENCNSDSWLNNFCTYNQSPADYEMCKYSVGRQSHNHCCKAYTVENKTGIMCCWCMSYSRQNTVGRLSWDRNSRVDSCKDNWLSRDRYQQCSSDNS